MEQENEEYYSEKQSQNIIAYYTDDHEQYDNDNGWGPEYYDHENGWGSEYYDNEHLNEA